MSRILMVAVLGLLFAACGGGIDSYEDGMEAQLEIMEEMMDVLADVTDQASAKAATPRIEALGNRLAEVTAQIRALPKPETEALQEIGKSQSKRTQEFLEKLVTQQMKLAEYPELKEAFARASANAE